MRLMRLMHLMREAERVAGLQDDDEHEGHQQEQRKTEQPVLRRSSRCRGAANVGPAGERRMHGGLDRYRHRMRPRWA